MCSVLPADTPWHSPTYFYLQINSLGSQNVSAQYFVSSAVCSLTAQNMWYCAFRVVHRNKQRSNFCFGKSGKCLKKRRMPHDIRWFPGLPTCHRFKVVPIPRKQLFPLVLASFQFNTEILLTAAYNDGNPYLNSVSLKTSLDIATIYSPGSRKIVLHYWHKKHCFLFSMVSVTGVSNRFWQRGTAFNIGRFADCTCKSHINL